MIEELLILHHTHVDIGYTHPQPVIWELQRRFIDSAIELCEATAGRPEPSRARWTCETTWPVLHWLDRANDKQIERFRRLVKAGQIGIGALPLHLTPLVNIAQLAHGLQAVGRLRRELGAPVKVAVSNDVNGLPWPVVGLLREIGVEALFMGINIHSGGFPFHRPRIFRWQGADDKELLVYNSTQYNTFGRASRYIEGSTEIMQESLDAYLAEIRRDGHKDNFVMLTSTFPQTSDNFPPDPRLAEMVHRWNSEGRMPLLRFATPEMVLEKMKSTPRETVPVLRGDWSDFWNFGAASTANATRVNRESSVRLLAAQMLQTDAKKISDDIRARSADAWFNLNLYDEHTWGSDRTVSSRNCDPFDEQWSHVAAAAWRARSLSGLLLRDELDRTAGNAAYGKGVKSVLCFNPAPVGRSCYLLVPKSWVNQTWDHCCSSMLRLDVDRCAWINGQVVSSAVRRSAHKVDPAWPDASDSILAGPFRLPASGYRVIPIKEFQPATMCVGMKTGGGVIETQLHRLRFNPRTGKITSLWDKKLRREFIDAKAEWPFFGFVRETPDPKYHRLDSQELGREAYYETNWDRIHADQPCWNHEWKARREGPRKLLGLRTEIEADGVSLVLEWDAPGVVPLPEKSARNFTTTGFFAQAAPWLTQRIKLLGHRAAVELTASFNKADVRHAEAIYFAFPLNLPKWNAHYDAAGVPTQWDAEQLEGSCKNWVTSNRWVSVHNAVAGVTLANPDAPLSQIGDFGFGRPQGFARRKPKPVLLSWVTNNYWVTNFPASQPGPMRFRYELQTHGAFDPVASTLAGLAAGQPAEIHPVVGRQPVTQKNFIEVKGDGIVPLQLKPAEDGRGLIIRLLNASDKAVIARIRLPGRPLQRAWRSNALEESLEKLARKKNEFSIKLARRAAASVRVEP